MLFQAAAALPEVEGLILHAAAHLAKKASAEQAEQNYLPEEAAARKAVLVCWALLQAGAAESACHLKMSPLF
jgi:hypothetical protein